MGSAPNLPIATAGLDLSSFGVAVPCMQLPVKLEEQLFLLGCLFEMTHDWLKSVRHGLHFLQPEHRAREVQKSSVLSDHLNYNMLKG